jgi:phage repressor protein C with HTH and peptisase S24 domain
MHELKHAFDQNAISSEDSFLIVKEECEVMDLASRLNAIAKHLIESKRETHRSWKGSMARAAGCSYANIRQAANGDQATMDYVYLSRIASWARVSERFLLDGVGPLLAQPSADQPASGGVSEPAAAFGQMADPRLTGSVLKASPLNVKNLEQAPVLAWARLGVDLYKGNEELADYEMRPYVTRRLVGPRCKFIEVADDSHAPRVRPGDLVLVDPDRLSPLTDELTLFATPDGAYRLLRFRPILGGFEGYDERGRALDQARHGLRIVACFVMLMTDRA